jgi:hypothetical protein
LPDPVGPKRMWVSPGLISRSMLPEDLPVTDAHLKIFNNQHGLLLCKAWEKGDREAIPFPGRAAYQCLDSSSDRLDLPNAGRHLAGPGGEEIEVPGEPALRCVEEAVPLRQLDLGIVHLLLEFRIPDPPHVHVSQVVEDRTAVPARQDGLLPGAGAGLSTVAMSRVPICTPWAPRARAAR